MHIGDWLGKRADLSPDKTALIDTIGGRAIDEVVENFEKMKAQ